MYCKRERKDNIFTGIYNNYDYLSFESVGLIIGFDYHFQKGWRGTYEENKEYGRTRKRGRQKEGE